LPANIDVRLQAGNYNLNCLIAAALQAGAAAGHSTGPDWAGLSFAEIMPTI
jgi:hypothetical protein